METKFAEAVAEERKGEIMTIAEGVEPEGDGGVRSCAFRAPRSISVLSNPTETLSKR